MRALVTLGGAPAAGGHPETGPHARSDHVDERIALFIDGANLYSASRALGFSIDFKRLLDHFGARGARDVRNAKRAARFWADCRG